MTRASSTLRDGRPGLAGEASTWREPGQVRGGDVAAATGSHESQVAQKRVGSRRAVGPRGVSGRRADRDGVPPLHVRDGPRGYLANPAFESVVPLLARSLVGRS